MLKFLPFTFTMSSQAKTTFSEKIRRYLPERRTNMCVFQQLCCQHTKIFALSVRSAIRKDTLTLGWLTIVLNHRTTFWQGFLQLQTFIIQLYSQGIQCPMRQKRQLHKTCREYATEKRERAIDDESANSKDCLAVLT